MGRPADLDCGAEPGPGPALDVAATANRELAGSPGGFQGGWLRRSWDWSSRERLPVVRRASLALAGRSCVLFPYEGEFDPSRPVQKRHPSTDGFQPAFAPGGNGGSGPSRAGASGFRRASCPAKKPAGKLWSRPSSCSLPRVRRPPGPGGCPSPGARDIETTLDGQKATLAIEPGGQIGEVAITRAGRHVLAVRRSFATRTEAGLEVLSFPVNAIASARVAGRSARERQSRGGAGGDWWNAAPSGRDALRPARACREDRAGVGGKGADAAPKQGGGSVEGVVLWDIHPAGDRVRTRLTYQSARELGSVRLEHPAGLILRGARVLGSGGFVWCESTGKGEWALHVDPPLEAGGTIEIDSWMPIEVSANAAGRPAREGALLESGTAAASGDQSDRGRAVQRVAGSSPAGRLDWPARSRRGQRPDQ